MKSNQNTRRQAGFTLIEMVGVLAVIAVLAALLIPRIFSAINESRYNNAIASYNSVKSAAMTYFGKYGKFGNTGGLAYAAASLPITNWDEAVLLPEGLIEKPFATRIGNSAEVHIDAPGSGTVSAVNPLFNLDGATTAGNNAGGNTVIFAVLRGVAAEDAFELDQRIDGPKLAAATVGAGTDTLGRLKWGGTGNNDVYIYIAHK